MQGDCERIVVGALAQPVLAITSLAYVAAGLAVLWVAARRRAPLAAVAGSTTMAVGIGSVIYHGPHPSWAGVAHDWPIVALAAVCLVGLFRSGRTRRSLWLAAAGVMALGLTAYVAGRTGSPLCRPDSLWQFHGVWHMLSATAAGLASLAMATARSADIAAQRFTGG